MLTIEDKQEIIKAIEEQEAKTSGEIVTVLAHNSGDYLFTCLLWSVFIALPFPSLLSYFPAADFISNKVEYAIFSQLAVLGISFIILNVSGLGVKLVPKRVKYRKSSNLASMQFYKQGLHLTKDRAAILLFISTAEKYVEIIADKGINDLVDNKEWADIISGFLDKVKNRQTKDAFLYAIDRCGNTMAKHFPVGDGDNKNELTNLLIEI